MKVRFKKAFSVYKKGDETELSRDLTNMVIRKGYAELASNKQKKAKK